MQFVETIYTNALGQVTLKIDPTTNKVVSTTTVSDSKGQVFLRGTGIVFSYTKMIARADGTGKPLTGSEPEHEYYVGDALVLKSFYVDENTSMGDKPAMIAYHKNGAVCAEVWKKTMDVYHREGDQPAVIIYNENGKVIHQEWLIDGKFHRENGPAFIDGDTKSYFRNGKPYQPKVVTIDSVLAKLQDLLTDVAELKKQ
jgi:hypothetical protein